MASTSGRRIRSWEEKRRIMAEAREPGASVAEVARRHDMNANLLFKWLLKAGHGRRASRAPAEITPPDQVEFVPLGHFAAVATEAVVASAAGLPAPEPAKAQRQQIARCPVRKARRRSGMIEIDLPCGTCVRVDASVNQGALRRVFQAMKALT